MMTANEVESQQNWQEQLMTNIKHRNYTQTDCYTELMKVYYELHPHSNASQGVSSPKMSPSASFAGQKMSSSTESHSMQNSLEKSKTSTQSIVDKSVEALQSRVDKLESEYFEFFIFLNKMFFQNNFFSKFLSKKCFQLKNNNFYKTIEVRGRSQRSRPNGHKSHARRYAGKVQTVFFFGTKLFLKMF